MVHKVQYLMYPLTNRIHITTHSINLTIYINSESTFPSKATLHAWVCVCVCVCVCVVARVVVIVTPNYTMSLK